MTGAMTADAVTGMVTTVPETTRGIQVELA
jgi:hypothetical protein